MGCASTLVELSRQIRQDPRVAGLPEDLSAAFEVLLADRSAMQRAGAEMPSVEAVRQVVGHLVLMADEAEAILALFAPHVARLTQERDEARAENAAIRIRTCDAHAAVYRAMRAGAVEALAALQDDGYVHRAVHAVLDGPEGTSAVRLDAAVQSHLIALGERALRAEANCDMLGARIAELEAELARQHQRAERAEHERESMAQRDTTHQRELKKANKAVEDHARREVAATSLALAAQAEAEMLRAEMGKGGT